MKNRLDRIVTKSGDSGLTSINPNKRISKNSNIVKFLGDLDELNAYIGTLKADLFIINPTENSLKVMYAWITTIQHTLFDIGGAVCSENMEIFDENAVAFLEEIIHEINQDLPPLKEFVLPGGSQLGAKAHVSRTVCRRAERSLVNLIENDPEYKKYQKGSVLPYINRLSDFFFVLSRRLDRICKLDEQTWETSKKRKNK
ncbi:MAG: cob(I)yrinic acid a,c-diamide adenosyltransferase [Burkholderiaceae bacterium]|nr:MAG: cob(I)yrinic acid a,c-diamide adenosyltransferase [Burkholderiaceae bacterium]